MDGDATLSESVGEMKTCLSLCILSVLGVAVVIVSRGKFTTEAQSSQRSHSVAEAAINNTLAP